MKIQLWILLITSFLVYNTYHDGKYTEMLKINQKYFKMASFAFIGLTMYLFIRKHPNDSKDLLLHANDIIKYMPIDKGTTNLIAPFFDFTQSNNMPIGHKRMLSSGTKANSRSVSETKKKYVASEQQWRCAECRNSLDATFEVHHKVPLYKGGTNHVNNLEALCRNCHGNKTIHDKII